MKLTLKQLLTKSKERDFDMVELHHNRPLERPHSYAVPEVEKDSEGRDLVKVFVYGTLKRGYGNDGLLRTSKYLGEGELSCYEMKYGESFPFIYRTGIYKAGHAVKGEVYQVNSEVLARLDRLEGVPDFYQRTKEHVAFHGYCYVYTRAKPTEPEWRVVVNNEWKGPSTKWEMRKLSEVTSTIPDYRRPALPPPPPQDPTFEVGGLLWPNVRAAGESNVEEKKSA